jgi:tagatose 6-phosphate kinase
MILVVGANSTWQKVAALGVLCPGEVNRLTEITALASGKGVNVLRTLHAIGEEALLLGYAGGLNGSLFRRFLKREKLCFRLQHIAAETRVCTTLIESDGKATEIIDPSPRITRDESEAFAGLFAAALPAAAMLVIAGSAPEGEAEDSSRRFTREAKQRGLPVLLDAVGSRGRAALKAGPDILKINLEELRGLTGRRLDTPALRLDVYRELSERYGLRWVVISDGPRGLEGYDGREALRAAPPAVRALNPIGSGDAVSAGIARAYLAGAGLAEALTEATALGTANCLSLIPGHFDLQQVRRLSRRISATPL